MVTHAAIIGATSSLACAVCQRLAKQSCKLTLLARDKEELELLAEDLRIRYDVEVTIAVADIADPALDPKKLVESLGTADAVLVMAGYMGEKPEQSPEEFSRVMQVNYINPARIIQQVADSMKEKKRKGQIVVIGSVAGDRGRQSNYVYGSAKGALAIFASGLRNKFQNSKVHVMTVKPGFVDTPMTWGMKSSLIASRESVAKVIISAMNLKKEVIYVPFFWRYIMLIIRMIPESIFKRTNI